MSPSSSNEEVFYNLHTEDAIFAQAIVLFST